MNPITGKEAYLAYRRIRNKSEEEHKKNAGIEIQLMRLHKDYNDTDKWYKLQLDKMWY